LLPEGGHFYRNVFSHVPNSKLAEVARMLKAIHDHKLTADAWPAVTGTVCVFVPTFTEYSPAGRETGWLSCLEASCVPAESNTE
jgi:hypothetical protein